MEEDSAIHLSESESSESSQWSNFAKQPFTVRFYGTTVAGSYYVPSPVPFAVQLGDDGIWYVVIQQRHVYSAIHRIFDPKEEYLFDIDIATFIGALQWPHIKELIGNDEFNTMRIVTEELASREAQHSAELLHSKCWANSPALTIQVFYALYRRLKEEDLKQVHVWLDLQHNLPTQAGTGCPVDGRLESVHYNPVLKNVVVNICYMLHRIAYHMPLSICSFMDLHQGGVTFAKRSGWFEGQVYHIPQEIAQAT